MIKNPYLNQDFLEFLQPQTNRLEWIQKSLLSEGIDSCVFQIGEQNHIYVKFPLSCYNPLFKIKTILVHYDRIGIGANDNSAAVYQVIKWASRLNSQLEPHNIRIIFTDGEEKGGIGASALISDFPDCPFAELNFIIELDRQGHDDCVFYRCDNKPFARFIKKFGFEYGWCFIG